MYFYFFGSLFFVFFSFVIFIYFFLLFSLTLLFFSFDFLKLSSYECGFSYLVNFNSSFSIHFFFLMIVFVLFDLEIVFLLGFSGSSFEVFFMFIFFFVLIYFSYYLEYYLGSYSWDY